MRLWRVAEETQLLFQGAHSGPIDAVAMLSPTAFLSGSQARHVESATRHAAALSACVCAIVGRLDSAVVGAQEEAAREHQRGAWRAHVIRPVLGERTRRGAAL